MVFEKNRGGAKKVSLADYWPDSIIDDFYSDHHQKLSSKEFDEEFNRNIKSLSRALKKLSDSERKAFVSVLSGFVGFYFENKIEKELDDSFSKVLKF